jgi:hypothetical protein
MPRDDLPVLGTRRRDDQGDEDALAAHALDQVVGFGLGIAVK